ncbi:MAG: glutamine synthetase beta-grasp domain-containing protein [Deltaproteobacteria bacterium]|nr:glutamine synthetase beta-grasp domain-containing protein [Deltaproteobacteria bacterium]
MAEYIWMDGAQPTQRLRSKTKIVPMENIENVTLEHFPEWGFDGSSTYQAQGHSSDLVLKPVCFVDDPIRGRGNFLVMCEVMNVDGTPHETNSRAKLRKTLEDGAAKEDPWFGFEQEYTLFRGRTPLGWPEDGYPAPQGPFYCGVGADEVFGRQLVEEHMQLCIDAGLMIYGINAEVMPGQWEYQVGYRGVKEESADALATSDHNWFARWLLYRIGEDHGITATLHPKPVRGDWNGAGQHTNFSTKSLRDPATGTQTMKTYLQRLENKHMDHIKVYGADLHDRLTGAHETCHINEFRSGPSDRGASIRIPIAMQKEGCGYLEDRRPGANADPYVIADRILRTICDL